MTSVCKMCISYPGVGCHETRNWEETCHAFVPTEEAKELLCEDPRKPAEPSAEDPSGPAGDPVNAPSHYVGSIEVIDYLRDKLTAQEFIGFCGGNVLKYVSRWRKKDGVQDLKKAEVYLRWMIEQAEAPEAPEAKE